MDYTKVTELDNDLLLKLTIAPKPKNNPMGVNSLAKNNKHIILLDYDDAKTRVLKRDMKHLHNKFNCNLFLTYQTGKYNWHIRIPEKVTYHKLLEIHKETHADKKTFKELTTQKRMNTHRYTKKGDRPAPKMLRIIKKETPKRTISNKHWQFFKDQTTKEKRKKMEEIEKDLDLDNSDPGNLKLVQYGTPRD